jgi:hypothetical protein
MKFELTNPKAWQAVSERNIPMGDKIKVYEKLGGAYRLGEDGGEQVFNDIKELLKHKLNEEDGVDHEVGMATNQLDDIIKNATELKSKVGTDETNLAGWIQDHISQAQNYINQANTGFHKLDGINESVNEANKSGDKLTHKHNPNIEIELIEPTNKGWKVYQIEKGKKKIAYFDKQDISGDRALFKSVNEAPDTKKRFMFDFYTDSNQRNTERETNFLATTLESAIKAAEHICKVTGYAYVEIYYKDLFLGSMKKQNGFKFVEGRDYPKFKSTNESVNEIAVSDNEMDKIKFAVQRAGSFMRIGAELKNVGIKYSFSTEPLPIYMIKVGGKYFALVNKKFADKPDFVIGDTAGGMMD